MESLFMIQQKKNTVHIHINPNQTNKITHTLYLLTSVEDSGLDVGQVLGEALVLLLDLEGQLSGVAQHHHVNLAGHGVQQVQGGQHEHSSLTHTW